MHSFLATSVRHNERSIKYNLSAICDHCESQRSRSCEICNVRVWHFLNLPPLFDSSMKGKKAEKGVQADLFRLHFDVSRWHKRSMLLYRTMKTSSNYNVIRVSLNIFTDRSWGVGGNLCCHGGRISAPWGSLLLGRSGYPPLVLTSSGGYCSGRYASYRNACLYVYFFSL